MFGNRSRVPFWLKFRRVAFEIGRAASTEKICAKLTKPMATNVFSGGCAACATA
jgi:hypothetical protein